MRYTDWTLSLAFVTVLLLLRRWVVLGETLHGLNHGGCNFKYKKHVEDKPNFFLMTNTVPGICQIHSEMENSTINYHQDRKYVEEIRPETVIGGLNYDAQNGTIIYWAKIANVDHSRLYKVRLNDSHWEPVLDQDDDFRDMSYDWISKNLYIIMGVRSLMVAVNVEKPWNPTVIMYDRKQLTSLAVHPNKGYLFFVETSYWYGVQNKIYRAHLDGTNVMAFNRSGSDIRYYIASLVVDFFSDRIYWSVPGMDKIQSSNLDGQDVRTITGVHVYSGQLDLSSRALAVDMHYVYYRRSVANVVRRIDKTSEVKDSDFELTNSEDAPITEIMAVIFKSQKIRKDHPCTDDRGGCEKYCFGVPHGTTMKRVCKCSFNEVVDVDRVSCVKRRQSFGQY